MSEITAALDRILFSLAEFRLELLSREADLKNVDPVYEFPRELRKLRNNLASYLVELTRPSHLSINPYLRGFYCTGVHARLAEQMVAGAAQRPQAERAGAGATRMLSAEQLRAAAIAPAQQIVTRKVAEWCFLPRLFPSVILEDRSALAASSTSRRTYVFKRTVFATLSLLLLAYLGCLIASWSNNSSLEREIVSAANALPTSTARPTTLAPVAALSALDQLRVSVARLESYQQNGPPLMYQFGLYHGDRLLQAARRIYFNRFQRLLLADTQTNLVAALSALPATPQPGADYSAAYNPLKAYLITTSNPDKSNTEFLPPVLLQYWQNGRVPDTDQQKQLASRQFEFYTAELPLNNPFNIAPDTLAVNHARTYPRGATLMC